MVWGKLYRAKGTTKANGGLFVETYSGTGLQQLVGVVGPRTDIRHIVRVSNYYLDPVRVVCTGSITANPSKLKFSSPQITDTDSTWKATAVIGPRRKHDFTHVTLLSCQTGFGDENVDIEIEGFWPATGEREKMLLTITVKA